MLLMRDAGKWKTVNSMIASHTLQITIRVHQTYVAKSIVVDLSEQFPMLRQTSALVRHQTCYQCFTVWPPKLHVRFQMDGWKSLFVHEIQDATMLVIPSIGKRSSYIPTDHDEQIEQWQTVTTPYYRTCSTWYCIAVFYFLKVHKTQALQYTLKTLVSKKKAWNSTCACFMPDWIGHAVVEIR